MKHKCNGCRYKGEHQEMMFRPIGVCLKETNLIEAEKNYNAEKCPYGYEEVYNSGYDTAGNFHMYGVFSGHTTIRKER